MDCSDENKEILFKKSSALIPEDFWFQDLPHIGNVRPYGLAAARAKAQLLKDYMDEMDSSSPTHSPSGEPGQNGNAEDGLGDEQVKRIIEDNYLDRLR